MSYTSHYYLAHVWIFLLSNGQKIALMLLFQQGQTFGREATFLSMASNIYGEQRGLCCGG